MINTSAYGVIDECRRHPEIDRIYASEHGIVGLIERRLFDITEEMAGEKLLPSTPSMIFGSCRYEIDENDPLQTDYRKILKNLKSLGLSLIHISFPPAVWMLSQAGRQRLLHRTVPLSCA